MRKLEHKRGYTLIELIVSVAIFSVVMLVASAAFLTLINMDRQARATNDAVTNLTYVVESMERSIRTGTGYQSVSGQNSFTFTDSQGRQVIYRRGAIGGRRFVEQCIGGTCYPLTDIRVDVQLLAFYSRGVTAGDTEQPMVVFVMNGRVTPDARSAPVNFRIQSTATQRLIDI